MATPRKRRLRRVARRYTGGPLVVRRKISGLDAKPGDVLDDGALAIGNARALIGIGALWPVDVEYIRAWHEHGRPDKFALQSEPDVEPGAEVEPEVEPEPEVEVETEDEFDGKTKAELLEFAQELELDVTSRDSKASILEALRSF